MESLDNNNSCITCNKEKGYFPLYDDNNKNKDNKFIKCYKLTEGYYLDIIDSVYKKCYDSCKYCDKNGNELMHNCLECKDDYNYTIQYEKYKNCYVNCSYYYYFDDDKNKLFCTQEMNCTGKYNKLIFGTNQCIDECNKINKYKFRNICYAVCPEGSIKSENESFSCDVICNEENKFELIEKQECVKSCSLSDLKKKNCIIKYKENTKINGANEEVKTTAQDAILETLRTEITNYDTSDIDKGKDDIIEDEKMTITLTTTENQKNNLKQENNITLINLGECETLLREYYKIQENEKIYIVKTDKIIEGMKIPKIEYDVYYKLNNSLIQLNKSVCENVKIDLLIPIAINEDDIQKLNSSGGYYNDICSPTTSIYGTDLTLKDRRKEFIDDNKTVCQDNCIFSDYDQSIKKATCSCDVEKSSSFFNDININKTMLLSNFIDIKNIANIKILGCYNQLLNKKGILKNIGFYILILIEIIHLICAIIFYCKEFKILKDNINAINFAIWNWELVIKDEKEKLEQMKLRKKKNIINNNLNVNIIKLPKKQENQMKNHLKKIIKLPNIFEYYHFMNILGYEHSKDKDLKEFPNPPIKKKQNTKKNNNIKRNPSSVNKINSKSNKKIIEKCKKIMAFNYFEMNDFSYKMALKYDQRTFCEYYLSLLKTKHILIIIFFNSKDYNSRIIKLDLFFISFAISYTVNALFFSEETISKINEEKGTFNFIYHIPQILYSFLISAVLNAIMKLLALSEENIIKFKKNKNLKDLRKRKLELKSKLRLKFAIYFIIGFIFILFCLYYLTMFCAIYKNTQIYLIKDTLISFGLSLFYPLLICLVPGIFRLPSLADKKKKRNYLYSISKLLQLI